MANAVMPDFASGIGGLDQAKGASLEQIVMDCDLWECARELRKDVKMDDAHFVLDLVRSVGPGGTFLKELHTAKNMKKELFIQTPEKVKNMLLYQMHRDRNEVLRSARERAGKILSTHISE